MSNINNFRINVDEIEKLKTVYRDVDKIKDKYSAYKEMQLKNSSLVESEETPIRASQIVKEQIKLRCLSYRKLASLTGVNMNLISQTCNGKLPSLDTFIKMCAYFDFTTDELIKIYEQSLKEALVIEVLKDKEAYERVSHIRAGGKLNGGGNNEKVK